MNFHEKKAEQQKQKLIDSIANWFKRAVHNIADFFRGINKEIKTYLAIIITLVSAIMKWMDKPVVEEIAGLISPQLKELIPNIESVLSHAILLLIGVDNIVINDDMDNDTDFLKAMLLRLVTYLNTATPFMKNAAMSKLASIILGLVDNNNHKESTYDALVQNAVIMNKNKMDINTLDENITV